jgi:ankyrin repeat protein
MKSYYEELKDLGASQITQVLSKACETGDLDKVRYLLVSHKEDKNQEDDEVFYRNIRDANLHRFLSDCLMVSCQKGHLELVKYLLTSPELPKKPDIQSKQRPPLSYACGEGHLDIVKYLLTSPELSVRADIHAENEAALKNAFVDGHIHVVRYLMESPDLESHPNIHKDNDNLFEVLFRNVQKNNGKMEIARYFIFDLNIERTKQIDKLLAEKPNEQIENWFKIRELNHDLENQLRNDRIDTKKKYKL